VALLARIQAEFRPEIVHAHGYKAGMVTSVAGARSLVVTFHNLWPAAAGRGARLGLRWTVRSARAQVAVSQAVRETVERAAGPLSGPVVIPNAVDVERFVTLPPRAAAREAFGLPPGAPVVGFAGRLTPVKGPQVLVEAAPLLLREAPEARIVIAGEGPLRPALEDAARAAGLAERVRFPGAVPDVRVVMAAADVWAVPSLEEGGGIVALEAMAAGLPLVASDVGGQRETVEPGLTGIRVPPGEPEALARALARLLDDGDLARRLGTAAREEARSRPDADEMARRVAEVYQSVTAVGDGRPAAVGRS
jgi:glycosyltransferase involved in cell wall biosynthesis